VEKTAAFSPRTRAKLQNFPQGFRMNEKEVQPISN
jgi:hypothetical protein